MNKVIEFSSVTKTFRSVDGPVTAVEGINLALRAGQTAALLGPSGSGKTTILSLAAGLDDPTTGQVRFRETDWQSLSEEKRASARLQSIGFIFQSFQLIGTLTAVENAMVPLELLGAPDAWQRGTELMGRVGLGHRLHHYPSQLSGGEQQRVAIARAFSTRPAVLFADEPTGNLDRATAHKVSDLIFDLNRESGTTLLMVTHDRELASRCGQLFELKDGRLLG